MLEIPRRAFFNFAFPCPYRSQPPAPDGDMSDWDDGCRIPDLMALDVGSSFADLWMAWNEDGLRLALDVKGNLSPEVLPRQPLAGDSLQVWLDTRDVRDAHRASRYCHHFCFAPGGGGRSRRKPLARQFRIRRARSHGRICDPALLGVASRISKSGYRMEVHIPADAMTGFDPEENTRLGFTYVLKDHALGRQFWTADEPLPVAYDPSLWGTVELVR